MDYANVQKLILHLFVEQILMFNLKIKTMVPKLRKPAAHFDLRRCLFRTNVDIPLRNTRERQSSTDFSKSHDECCILHAFRGNFKVEIQSPRTSSSPSPTCERLHLRPPSIHRLLSITDTHKCVTVCLSPPHSLSSAASHLFIFCPV